MIARMPHYVAFLRAVNVAGRFVTMAELRSCLEAAGLIDVETHIQSGNVRVGSTRRSSVAVAADLRRVLSGWAGFDIPAIVRTPQEVTAIVAAVDRTPPLLDQTGRRYVAFSDSAFTLEAAAALDGWDRPGERMRSLGADVLAELTVDFHKATLTNARIERITGTTTTWRDLKVVREIAQKWGRP